MKGETRCRRLLRRARICSGKLTSLLPSARFAPGSLEDVERELARLVAAEGRRCDDAVRLVRENEATLRQMKARLRRTSVAEISRILVVADGDGARATIEPGELNELTLRITLALEMRGIDFDGEAFKALVRGDNDVAHVLKGPSGECGPRARAPVASSPVLAQS